MAIVLKPLQDASEDAEKPARSRGRRRPSAVMTTFARVDYGVGGSGIFRQVEKRERDDEGLEDASSTTSSSVRLSGVRVEFVHDGRRLAITSPYALNATDLSIFLAICACAGLVHNSHSKMGVARKQSSRAPQRHLQGDLLGYLAETDAVARLKASGDEWVSRRYLRLQTTIHTLLGEAGMTSKGGNAYNRVLASLERLRGVYYTDYGPVSANSRRARSGESLLSYAIEEATGAIEVLLNNRLTEAIVAPGYASIDMQDMRSLREASKILLLRLSARLREGAEPITLEPDELAEMIYGPPPASPTTRRTQRYRALKAVAAVGELSQWRISTTAAGAHIRRLHRSAGQQPLPSERPAVSDGKASPVLGKSIVRKPLR